MKYEDIKYEVEKKHMLRKNFKRNNYAHFDKRLFFAITGLCIVLAAILFVLWVPSFARPVINESIKSWVKSSKGHKLEVTSFDYRKMSVSLSGITFEQVQAKGALRFDYPYFPPRQFEIDIPVMQVSFKWHFSSGFRLGLAISGLEVKGGDLLPSLAEAPRRLEAISKLTFQAWISVRGMPSLQWKRQLVDWARQFKNWALNGAHMQSVYMSGNATFLVDGVLAKVRFFSEEERNGSSSLRGDQNDMRQIALLIEPKFTEQDVWVATKNLLKTPKLLDIRTRAEAKAEATYKAESGISYDTFRHIFWSYYLTQSFGRDFAVRVTNAHEFEDPMNTAEESEKDRRNNTLGAEYAQRKIPENEIEKMIVTDPRVRQNQAA